ARRRRGGGGGWRPCPPPPAGIDPAMPTPLRWPAVVLFAVALRLQAAPSEADVARPIRGFSAKAAAEERAVEARFHAIPSPDEARRWHRAFTSVPHPATSKANHDVALTIAQTWKEQGRENVVLR